MKLWLSGCVLLALAVPCGDASAQVASLPASAPASTQGSPSRRACAAVDDDGDAVNNCEDLCPGSQAGQAIGPDGCPLPLMVEVKGVNFAAGSDALGRDAVATLDEAVAILGKFPQLRVDVGGHADATEAHGQALSLRRARVVHRYLRAHGIAANRLEGPTGYGASRPIAPNTRPDGADDPQGRAQNRRAELKVLD